MFENIYARSNVHNLFDVRMIPNVVTCLLDYGVYFNLTCGFLKFPGNLAFKCLQQTAVLVIGEGSPS